MAPHDNNRDADLTKARQHFQSRGISLRAVTVSSGVLSHCCLGFFVKQAAAITMLRLRCKTREGSQVLQGLTALSSIRELKESIAGATGIVVPRQRVMVGFPPANLDLSNAEGTLGELPIKSGDTLIVEEDKSKPSTAIPHVSKTAAGSKIERRVVPADNSCLFTSIYYVVEGGIYDPACAPEMRNLIADIVFSDPLNYCEAVLGKNNDEYCKWIRRDDTWGGAIEISILSKFFQCEICVVDTQTARIDRFGEDAGYTKRVMLIYDGIHYDPLQRLFSPHGTPPMTIFSTLDDEALVQALALAEEARKKRQFTDVNRFALRCMVCQKGLTGQAAARDHAKETGHTNFGEV
uniref:Ubiquitin thioesterase OTU n=1 Tax=Leptobrachium leishanense TaxID=445787 RepID=A0A8C5LMX5_9ANUR